MSINTHYFKAVLRIHEILLLLFEGTFTSFFKEKKVISHKTVGINVFLTISTMFDDGRIRVSA